MIKKEDIEKLAELSRIEVTDDEVSSLSTDIEAILDYVSELTEIAVEEPVSEAGKLKNIMRNDGTPHESGIYTDAILKAAPGREKNYFKVKKILE
jgi:aspartyl-tRNA(Asn)/glutamyl-tRNA(Gln) amidotransferase subunit C